MCKIMYSNSVEFIISKICLLIINVSITISSNNWICDNGIILFQCVAPNTRALAKHCFLGRKFQINICYYWYSRYLLWIPYLMFSPLLSVPMIHFPHVSEWVNGYKWIVFDEILKCTVKIVCRYILFVYYLMFFLKQWMKLLENGNFVCYGDYWFSLPQKCCVWIIYQEQI